MLRLTKNRTPQLPSLDASLHGCGQKRRMNMGPMKVWYDKEGDFLEVIFREAKGYMHDIGDDVFEKVDEQG